MQDGDDEDDDDTNEPTTKPDSDTEGRSLALKLVDEEIERIRRFNNPEQQDGNVAVVANNGQAEGGNSLVPAASINGDKLQDNKATSGADGSQNVVESESNVKSKAEVDAAVAVSSSADLASANEPTNTDKQIAEAAAAKASSPVINDNRVDVDTDDTAAIAETDATAASASGLEDKATADSNSILDPTGGNSLADGALHSLADDLGSTFDISASAASKRSPLSPSAVNIELATNDISLANIPTDSELSSDLEDPSSSPSAKRSLLLLEPDADPCNEPVQKGSCKGSVPRFYFSHETKTCQQFAYSGCGQNSNNFGTLEECMKTCDSRRGSRKAPNDKPKKLEFGSSASGTGIYNRNRVRRKFPIVFCTLPLDLGSICPGVKRGSYLEQFFYDSRVNRCAPFVYSGCGGNANRFSSMWECTQNCGKHAVSQTKTP
jgi:hypothetical protein